MVLAEDVRDMGARLLLSKGCHIQPEHIKMFKMWGIGEVSVVGNLDAERGKDIKSNPLLMEKIAGQVKHQFKMNNLRHPIVKEIFAASILFRCKSGQISELEAYRAEPRIQPEAPQG